jgi:crossover junction endodeoxyribonuclease RuvC
MKYLGVDPGIHGGLAILEINGDAAPQMLAAIDVPTIGVKAKEVVNVIALQEWLLQHKPAQAFVERAQSRPGQGSSSGFKYGKATGSLETTIALCGIPIEIIEASAWKRFFHLHAGDKEGARQLALQRFPSAHALLARRKDHNRAEAMLIALFASARAGRVAA